jgi:hypothetical protein
VTSSLNDAAGTGGGGLGGAGGNITGAFGGSGGGGSMSAAPNIVTGVGAAGGGIDQTLGGATNDQQFRILEIWRGGGTGSGTGGGAGGSGGGGTGGSTSTPRGTGGTENTGGGGGGSRNSTEATFNGGSRIVIISYPDTNGNVVVPVGLYYKANGTGTKTNGTGVAVTPTNTTGDKKIYEFLEGSGNIQIQ